ncbi:PD-(D/E)XK nuclease family protein [Halarcobacter anaerophilus]|uniref:PD-(D/E)XK nuclease family protein n=1 Tax=Halarcobacter anaerophilus TaxID=877500 RepID=UPI0005CA4B49|nr:PD-(D/E)XK nuclease family protein [Halarcobacter anaerophilus]
MQSRTKLLVFPTSRSIREYVNSQKEFNTLLPAIITIDELFKKSLVFENKKYLDEDERFLYLKEAVKNVDLDSLGISSSFSYFIKQSDYIYRFFLELASENVDIESISSIDTYGFYSEHLEILKQIRKNFLEILDRENFVDRINFSKYFSINSDFIKRYDEIELYFEGYFTKFEFEIIKSIIKYSKLVISFVYNQFNKKSIEKFIEYGFDLTLENSYAIDFSNKMILEEKKLVKKCENIEIKGFSSRVNQIAFIKKAIVDSVNKGINPSKIALILPDESFTTTISLFDNEGYFNYAMGLNIYSTNLFKTIDAIYAYMNESEIKNIKNLEFIDCNKELVDKLFKANWNKIITIEIFEEIIKFFISKETNKELLEKFNELVYKLYKIVFSYEDKIRLKDVYKIFYQRVVKLTLDDINSGKVTVMGLLESRRLEFDAVIICDFNESFIPKRSLKDKFLSTKLKQSANLPTSVDRENLQKYYYERLINNSKNVYISYVKNENEQISRFANLLFKENIDENLYDNSYKHILYKSSNLKHFSNEVILDIDLSKLTWSASSLKEFLECKRKFYLNHILKIKEHDISLKPKGYELGNIIHKTLEEFYKEKNRDYKTLLNIFNKNRTQNSFLNLELEIWKKRLKEFIEEEDKRVKEGFINIEQEKAFLFDLEGIKLRGTIDRIDKKEDKFYVIDYKTSSNLKVDSKKNYDKSKDFQLEFYYLAVKKLYKAKAINTLYYDLYEMKLKEEIALEEKLEVLKDIFSTFKTQKVNFDKCESLQTCQYCVYSTICNR